MKTRKWFDQAGMFVLAAFIIVAIMITGQWMRVNLGRAASQASLPPIDLPIPLTGPTLAVYLPVISAGGPAYYVSTSGNDSNPGTLTQPWRTIGKAVRTVNPGDTVLVRGGTYNEMVEITRSGRSDGIVHYTAYPGETVIIEGGGVRPSSFTGLVTIRGDWIKVSNWEVRNSKFMGVILIGRHNTVSGLYVHHAQRNGILITGDYNTVEYNRVWRVSMYNEFNQAGSNDTGLSAARDPTDGLTQYALIRGNTVWEVWGEGLSSFEADQVTITDNIVHDNLVTNIYISDSTHVVCSRNFVYNNPTSYVYGYSSMVGIMMGDERYDPPSAHIQVTNNIVYGTHRNFFWWQGLQGGGMNDVLIANNTLVNASESSNVIIAAGPHQNVQFINNIVRQDGDLPVISTVSQAGVTYANNLWTKPPLTAARGTGDQIGSAGLLESGTPYSPAWYPLGPASIAIDKGQTLSAVVVDFFNAARGAKADIGADEYQP